MIRLSSSPVIKADTRVLKETPSNTFIFRIPNLLVLKLFTISLQLYYKPTNTKSQNLRINSNK